MARTAVCRPSPSGLESWVLSFWQRGVVVRRGIVAVMVASAVLAAGCGYRPLGTEALPANVRTVGVGPVGNTTYRPGLQGLLAEAVHQRLQADGRVRVRPSTEADAVIEMVVSGYGIEGVAWDQQSVARRFRVSVVAGMNLRDRRNQRILISDGLVGEAYYTAGSGVGTTLSAEEEATRRAVRDLADRIGTRIIEGL